MNPAPARKKLSSYENVMSNFSMAIPDSTDHVNIPALPWAKAVSLDETMSPGADVSKECSMLLHFCKLKIN